MAVVDPSRTKAGAERDVRKAEGMALILHRLSHHYRYDTGREDMPLIGFSPHKTAAKQTSHAVVRSLWPSAT